MQRISSAAPRATRPAHALVLPALALGIAVGAQFTKSAAGATCLSSAEVMARLELLFGNGASSQGPPIT